MKIYPNDEEDHAASALFWGALGILIGLFIITLFFIGFLLGGK
jgi:hypothetical protein